MQSDVQQFPPVVYVPTSEGEVAQRAVEMQRTPDGRVVLFR